VRLPPEHVEDVRVQPIGGDCVSQIEHPESGIQVPC
jgi:hypothetical protein